MNNLTIKPSPIHGQGVFADREFKEKEAVINWEPCVIQLSAEEIQHLEPQERQYVKNNTLLQSPSRFLNHSCEANTSVVDGKNVALRDIKKDEEVTIDYTTEDIPHLGMRCKCGSGKCRGFIHSSFEKR